MLGRFLEGFLGYSYLHYIKSPVEGNHLCFVERVDVVFWMKSYTLVCVTTELLARNKVQKYNELWAPSWIKKETQ